MGYRKPASQERQGPVSVRCHAAGAHTVRVAGLVDGKPCDLTVDTGAERTLLREGVLDRRDIPRADQDLCGVTGASLALKGPVDATVQVAGARERVPVFVADIEENLLGLDYLRQVGAVLDLGEQTLVAGEEKVPLVEGRGDDRVTVCSSTLIPPCSETSIRVRLGRVTAGEALLSPHQETEMPEGVLVGHTLAPPGSKEAQVVVVNLAAEPRTVPEGLAIATCEEVERVTSPPEQRETPQGSSKVGVPPFLQDLWERSKVCLSREQAARVGQLLEEYADVFSRGDTDLGRTGLVKHRIHTGDAAPIKVPPRRIAPARRQEVEVAVKELWNQGVIEKSSSPWSAAIVPVRKKDGSTRVCVDYRGLNAVTRKDSYPLPRIDATLDALVGASWFSTLDLKSGYHQVEMAEEDKEKTAFSYGQGLWHFKVLSFGLVNAPATFERLMERVLDGLLWKSALVYLDDVLVYGSTFEETVSRLEEVLGRLRLANLKLSPKKCCLFQREVPFLGHIVSGEGVRTDPEKVVVVEQWPVPKSVTEVRSFLGLCTYYRRFVKDFATIASPLHGLTRKGARYQWTQECQEAFQRLKDALVSAPVLPFPDPSKPYVLDCDASAVGMGAVLSQEHGGKEWVVGYFSQKFTVPEVNYCVTRKELLAIVRGITHFHPYLYGAKFKVRTDHAALRWLKSLRNPEGQLARWIGYIEQHDYEIEHRAGRVHNNADSLSRRPCEVECAHCKRREDGPSEVQCARVVVDRDDNKVYRLQREDAALGPVLRWMEEGSEKPPWERVAAYGPETKALWQQWEALGVKEGVLHKKWESSDGTSIVWQVILPKKMREDVVREAHSGKVSGHFGVKKTYARLAQRAYWVGMRQDAKEWVKACEVCRAKMGPHRRGVAPLQLYQVGAPMERIAVDIAGPFPTTERGNRFILVVMDYFTKWPEAFPLPNHEATTVAEVLVTEVFARFGVPWELHSDQGREFESCVFREWCQLLGIRKTRTTPLHPQSDGMVERFNRTLVQQLAKYCAADQSDWDKQIPFLLMAYRSAVHEATGYTPSLLNTGREMCLPMDIMMGRPAHSNLPEVTATYVRNLKERLGGAYQQVRGNLTQAGEVMKRRHDLRASLPIFQVGDRVWLHNPRRRKGLSPKLQSPWEGPYEVVDALSAVTFRIRRGPRSKPLVVHADRLWGSHPPEGYTWDDLSEGSAPSEEEVLEAEEDLGLFPQVEGAEALPAVSPPVLVGPAAWSPESSVVEEAPAETRTSGRTRRPPVRMADYVLEDP